MKNGKFGVFRKTVTLSACALALWASQLIAPQTANALDLAATGAGSITLSSATLSFGSHVAGTKSAAQGITLTNSGAAAVTMTLIAVTGGEADDFAQSNNCGASLAAGASCNISVFFTPVSAGAKSAVLTLTDSATGSPQHVSLSGTGTAAAVLSVSATSLNFGALAAGNKSTAQSITLTNVGTATVTLASIAVSGAQADDFVQSNNCGASLAAGTSCSLAVVFIPVSVGAKSATLTLAISGGGLSQNVALLGTGTLAPALTISTSSVNLGSAPVGTSSPSQSIALTNGGSTAISFTSIAVTGGEADDFAQSNNCGTSLAIKATCNITVFFTPVSAGVKSVALTITDSVTGSPQRVSLSGTGEVAAPTALTYPSPQIFAAGTAISPLSPTVTGTVTQYYALPALPAGLALNVLSGQISGTPTTATPTAKYVITAANGTGSTSFSMTLTVRIAAPSALSYRGPKTYSVGTPITPLYPTVTGTVTTYGIAPALPPGLTLNESTGIISGTPIAAEAAATYTVTASNSTGSTSYALSITAILLAPQSLSYPSPQIFAMGLPVTPLSPFVVGIVTSYSVSPALPAGLRIDATSGVISGTPTTDTLAATYTIKAANATGSAAFAFVISVATVGVAPAHIARLVAAGTPLTVQLAVASQSLTGTLYVTASDPSGLFNSAAGVTTTANGYAVALEVSTTIAAGHYTGNVTLKMCRDAACTSPQAPGSISVPFDAQVLSSKTAWIGNNTPPLAAWNGVADWTMFQGNAAHTGYVPVSVDPNSFTTRWQGGPSLDNDAGYSDFASTLTTDGGQLYIATGKKLYALKELDASQVWSYDVSGLQFPSVNPPAEANGTVYMAAGQQTSTYLFAFDETTGAVEFQSLMSSQWEHYLAPTIGADGVYTNAGTYGGLYGFDFAGNQLFFDPGPQTSQWTPAVDDDHIYSYVGDYTGGLTIADPVTGTVTTTISDPTYQNYTYLINGSAVLGAPGSVFAANYENAYLNGGGSSNYLLDFNVPTQSLAWKIAGEYANTPAYNAGVVYVANNKPLRLEARNELDGSLLWSWTPPLAGDTGFNSEVLLTKSIIFVSTNLATYGIDAVTHQLVFSYPFSGRLALSHNGILYIQGTGPTVAINVK